MNCMICNESCGRSSSCGYAFFGVFDGHGGSEAATFADKHLRREIERQETFWSEEDDCVVDAIKDGFVSTHKLMMTAVGLFFDCCCCSVIE